MFKLMTPKEVGQKRWVEMYGLLRACLDSARVLYINVMVISGLYQYQIFHAEVVPGSTASLYSQFGRTLLWIEDWTDPPSSVLSIVTTQQPAL